MRVLLLPLRGRFIVYTFVLMITAILLFGFLFWWPSIYVAIPLALFVALSAIGTMDLFQTRHAVLRNYPLTASALSWRRFAPRFASIFLKAKRTGRHFPATSAPSSTSAPSRLWTSAPLAPRTTSMRAAPADMTIQDWGVT